MYAKGTSQITEPYKSRDHTERMLKYFGANIEEKGTTVTINGGDDLKGKEVFVPSDISSASFFIVAALIMENSTLLIKDVGINPTRSGAIKILKMMGAEITTLNLRYLNNEPVCDLLVKSSNLKGVEIKGDIIPTLIDEIPILAVAASQADGKP